MKFDHVEKNVRPVVQEAQASPNQLSTLFGDTTMKGESLQSSIMQIDPSELQISNLIVKGSSGLVYEACKCRVKPEAMGFTRIRACARCADLIPV